MADRSITVLTPATDVDLMSLTEAKLMMGLDLTDTSEDTQLNLWIDINSSIIARLCNRVFAREEVSEEWRELTPGHRLFLSHWPVHAADIESVMQNGALLDPSAYELEEDSGKLSIFTQTYWTEPVVVVYWGGFNLPSEAPLPLKQACAILNIQSKLLASLGQLAGIRQLSHKEARIAFHDPMKILEAALGGMGSPTQMAVMNILSKYMRFEV